MSLKQVAKETLQFLEEGGYDHPRGPRVEFAAALGSAVAGTQVFTPAMLEKLLNTGVTPGPSAKLEVTGETTQVAAHRLVTQEEVDDLVMLNFASAQNAGGGFLNGAKAQEEDLARCSGLYPCLLAGEVYYQANRKQRSPLYTDHMIYSPGVPWFRTRSKNLLETCFLASVITAPAPNAGVALTRDPDAGPAVEGCLRRRAAMVLALARKHGHRHLLLGAWGCGVFRNDPAMVADAFATHLESASFAGAFDRVTFAVYDRSKSQQNRLAFNQRCFT